MLTAEVLLPVSIEVEVIATWVGGVWVLGGWWHGGWGGSGLAWGRFAWEWLTWEGLAREGLTRLTRLARGRLLGLRGLRWVGRWAGGRLGVATLSTAVADEDVGWGAWADISDGGATKLLETVADGTTGDTLESHKVGSKTSNVRSGHGGTRHGLGTTTWTGRDNVGAGSEEVNYIKLAKVSNTLK